MNQDLTVKVIAVRFAPGDLVRVADGEISGRIDAVTVRSEGIRYCVTWWDAGTRREDWFDADEIQG